MTMVQTVKLHNGVEMLIEGVGAFQVNEPAQCQRIVEMAMHMGYRLLATVSAYQNETAMGAAVQASCVTRQELFVTTKAYIIKRVCGLFLALMLAVSLSACNPAQPVPMPSPGDPSPGSASPLSSNAIRGFPHGNEAPTQGGKVVVVYFSATGTTEDVAAEIAAYLDAGLFEIVPETPYTEAGLNYNSACRANDEQQDDTARPAVAADCTVEDWDSYNVVFLGHPIWGGIPPKIMQTFAEQYDWGGKTVVPFCTSGGSEYSSEGLPELTEGAYWLEGRCFSGGTLAGDVARWVDGLGLDLNADVGAANTLTVQCGDASIVYELNDSPAAKSLLAQLPLTLEVEPYSFNEQTFYPPEKLDTTDTPAITSAQAGTLAYFAPWGDVVMFYEGFSGGNGGLYELGNAVGGIDAIQILSGTITIR